MCVVSAFATNPSMFFHSTASSVCLSQSYASLGALNSRSGGGSGSAELSESSVLVLIAEEEAALDSLGGLGGLTDVNGGGGGVALRAGLSLGNSVLCLVLQIQCESSSEIRFGAVLAHGDADGVGSLAGVVATINGERRGGPVLAHPARLVAVEALSECPDNFR